MANTGRRCQLSPNTVRGVRLPNGKQTEHFFITALGIAGNLKSVLAEAEEISLQAMNAKAVVARAGESARAIHPIVDHAEELSRGVIRLVEQINRTALEITRTSISEFTEEVATAYFRRAQTLGAGARYIGGLDKAIEGADKRLDELHRNVADEVRGLSVMLDDIESALLAASFVTSKFRLEVGVSGSGYRENFEALVQKFETAVVNIQELVQKSQKALAVNARSLV